MFGAPWMYPLNYGTVKAQAMTREERGRPAPESGARCNPARRSRPIPPAEPSATSRPPAPVTGPASAFGRN